MRSYYLILFMFASLTLLTACTTPRRRMEQTPATGLISCAMMTPAPDRGSLLPPFIPAYACALENRSIHVDFCMVQASPTLSYPCSQTESVQESVISKGDTTQLIQRDYQVSAGCWHGTSYAERALRVCDRRNGQITTLHGQVQGTPLPSPDGVWFAFVAAAPDNVFAVHLFRVRADGTALHQLDTKPFPQAQVVGATIRTWAATGVWLEVLLWDGRDGGWHPYRLYTDGSGTFEKLP